MPTRTDQRRRDSIRARAHPRQGPSFTPDLVDAVIDAAMGACIRQDTPGLADAVGLLATGPEGTDGPVTVDRTLGRLLLVGLGEAWANGWQPADLARVVQRDLGRRHGRLAAHAMAREMALYPAATVPPRWRAQVDELDPGVPRTPTRSPGSDGSAGADERWAVPVGSGGDRRSGIRVAVETLALLRRLPPVPKLASAPGEATDVGEDDPVDPRVLQRVRGLLAKAESTTFPEEAEALTAKAQQLMARHAIDAAMLAAARGHDAEAVGRRLGVDDPYAASKAMLLDAISSANRCRSVWSKGYGYATVFGDDGDLDAVELLYTSLLVQAARAMFADTGGKQRSTAGRTRSFRQSFLVAFAMRIGDRLREAVDAATAEHSVRRETLLPVLAGRRDAADAACRDAFPEVRSTRLSARDHAGWQAGKKAADAAQLDMRPPLPADA